MFRFMLPVETLDWYTWRMESILTPPSVFACVVESQRTSWVKR